MRFSEKEAIVGVILGIIIIALLFNLFWAKPTNIDFCGDGECSKGEINVCKLDCDWCGDGYCQKGEDCSLCSNDCGDCGSDSFCGDGICDIGECASACWKDCQYSECENGICEIEKGENCINSPNDCKCEEGYCDGNTKQCVYQSCGNKICESHETSLNCPNDCKEKYIEVLFDPNTDFPIIFVHGHSKDEVEGYSPTELEEFQNEIVKEGYENKGIMLPSDYPSKLTKGIWSRKKVSVIMTYYANKYDKLGGVVGPDDNQHIDVYSQRLRDVVNVIKHNTGKNKVIIIAHSMGGLVSRNYIRNHGGINNVDKLIMIGTPNHGTYGLVSFGCGTFFAGRNPTPECGDMESDSEFINSLNSEDETPGEIKYLTIIGRNKKVDSCPDTKYSDNVICSSSVYLDGSENFYYDDFSEDYWILGTKLHILMVKPSKTPEVYNKIIEFLKK